MQNHTYRIAAILLAALFALASCSSAGAGDDDTPTDTTAPAPVTDVAIEATATTQVAVTWNDPTDADLARVVVTWSSTGGTSGSTEVDSGVRRAVIYGLRLETAYTIAVAGRGTPRKG